MKRYIIPIIITSFCLFLFNACDVMDTKPFESYSEDMVWGSKQTADAYVMQTYAEIMPLYTSRTVAEGWSPNETSYSGWSADGVARETIDRYYDAGFDKFSFLRRCNMIIEKSQSSTGLSDRQKTELIAEGHMLRALVYYYQAIRMGRFVPINKVLTPSDTAAFSTPLTASPVESYKYILDDVNAAIAGLPKTSPSGRMNVWTAAAFKSRICLSAAAYSGDASYYDQAIAAADSVINNGPYTLDQNYGDMFLETGKNSNEIIMAVYKLSENTTADGIAELINMVPNVGVNAINKSNCSPMFKNEKGQTFLGWHFFSPTQNLVDDYLVIDQQDGKAKAWDKTSQYTQAVSNDLANMTMTGTYTAFPVQIPSSDDMGSTTKGPKIVKAGIINGNGNISQIMYENRDKRFYGTIIYDSTYWLNNELVTTCCNGNLWTAVRAGAGGQPDSYHTTTTNYYWRKGVYNVQPILQAGQKTDYHYVIIRLGEVYLNKAEALLMKNQAGQAVEMLNKTRTIHGQLPASTAASPQDAWADYKRERRVELPLENDYFWSLLRWGKYGGYANDGKAPGDVVADLNVPAYKIQITKDRKRFFIGQVTSNFCYDRNFSVKRYLFPIPQGQIDKRSASGIIDTQNPGW